MTHTIAARWPQGRWQRSVMLSLLLVLLCLPLPRTLKQHRLVRERDRAPAWSEDLRHLAAQHSGPDVVVFGVPHAIEAMFYADLTAYNFLPDRAAVEKTMASGRDVVVFDQGSLPGWVHEADGIRVFVPRTKETR